jgi:hypothetical protein
MLFAAAAGPPAKPANGLRVMWLVLLLRRLRKMV